ncbi:MAG: Ribbon-helix-helix protein, copG family [Promethearchaeota archaeon]|nr:MAG: Ribbon-helix-helix protein, copG family [Candidatus Lokiarchaeota archaeon]
MKKIHRVTVALDEETYQVLQKLKEELKISQSDILRQSLKFFHKNRQVIGKGTLNEQFNNRISIYLDMLAKGEHLILDLDHYLSFLDFINNSPEKEKFWLSHREIAKAHAEEFIHKISNLEEILFRLESCNFFKMIKESPTRYTLLLGSNIPKQFIKIFLEEVFDGIGIDIEIKEDFSKLRISISDGAEFL